MEIHPIVWGLDIGHTSVKATKLSRAGNTVTVMAYGIEPIVTGEGVDRDDAVVKALQALAQREDIGPTPVLCSLSGRQIFSRTINLPIINARKIEKMVELEARQQIPGDFNEVRWGYHLSPSIDGTSHDVALFAAKHEIIDDLVSKTKRAGLNLVGISVSSLAVYNYVRFDQDFQASETVMVLDVGAENTDLVVYQGESLWMRSLGLAGNDITRAFMKKFRVSFEEAEQLKCQVAESRQADKIFKVIEGSLGELITEVQRSLGFYKQQNADANFSCVVASGNTFKLPNLTQYVADRLGYPIITLVELERIKIDPAIDRTHFLQDLQSLAAAMGLALQGVGLGKSTVNLLPSSLRLQSVLRAKRWAAIVALVALPVAFGINHVVLQGRMTTNHDNAKLIADEKALVTKEMERAQKALNDLVKPSQELSAYADYVRHIGVLRSVETGVLGAVAQIALKHRPPPGQGIEEGGNPLLQAIYFESLQIPNGPGEGIAAFNQLGQERTVLVRVRVPNAASINQPTINAEFRSALMDIRVTPAVWRVYQPEQDRLPDAGLPRLFSKVTSTSATPTEDVWWYVDPFKINPATGNLASEAERMRRLTIPMTVLTYQCSLAPIAELAEKRP
jgi:type IV pilus assembly protein PilM